jgi:hypothetical protein
VTASKSSIGIVARRASRLPLAPIAGGMLAAAVAFLCLMVPVWMLERLSVQWGLPAMLGAATPPLGMKARLIVAIVCGGFAFLAGATLVSLLDRSGRAARVRRPSLVEEIIEPEEEDVVPLRRRTFDASVYEEPERETRPILAHRELGLPMDDVVEERPLAWTRCNEDDLRDGDIIDHAPLPGVRLPEFVAPVEAVGPEEDWLDLGAFPIADVVPEYEPESTAARVQAVEQPDASPAPVAEQSSSVASLMTRLEAGLVRRGLAGLNGVRYDAAGRATGAPVVVRPPADMDQALRDALQELQRVTAGRA